MNLKSIITKKICTFAICATMLVSVVAPFASADTGKYGDADGNGTIAMGDVTTIQKHIADIKKLSAEAEKLSDVTADKKVDLKDVVLIQRYVALLIKEFPAEAIDKLPENNTDTDTNGGTTSDTDKTPEENQTEFNYKYHYDSEGNLIIEYIGNP